MDFDEETIAGFKKIITDGLAYGIQLHDDAIHEENDGKHIAIKLFQEPPPTCFKQL